MSCRAAESRSLKWKSSSLDRWIKIKFLLPLKNSFYFLESSYILESGLWFCHGKVYFYHNFYHPLFFVAHVNLGFLPNTIFFFQPRHLQYLVQSPYNLIQTCSIGMSEMSAYPVCHNFISRSQFQCLLPHLKINTSLCSRQGMKRYQWCKQRHSFHWKHFILLLYKCKLNK